MSKDTPILGTPTIDELIFDLEPLKNHVKLSEFVTAYLEGNYQKILRNASAQGIFNILSQAILQPREEQDSLLQDLLLQGELGAVQILLTGLTALNAFLQANVTGPPLKLDNIFSKSEANAGLKAKCLKSLEVDGVSVYEYIPHVELFCLARFIFTVYFPRIINGNFRDCKWMRIRINSYHQRLLSGGSGGRLSDSAVLQDMIEGDLKKLEEEIFAQESSYSTEAKVQFLLEKAQIYIMQGLDLKAKDNVKRAKTVSGFSYALSGALGKRTKFQQTDISQLVVFARSENNDEQDTSATNLTGSLERSALLHGGGNSPHEPSRNIPTALELNDDTLLESIQFTKVEDDKVDTSDLPPELIGMQPDDQPQLRPLDQITLLTEATIKDNLSPLDKLNSEEILPYAVRVLSDKPTNWQIYTQALLVRSRIESHRSRTQERSVLQLQVIVDQIVADTQEEALSSPDGIPEIRITQFLPRAKASESAPVSERLKYIYQLNSPTRWEVETELAYAWSNVGSLVSALEIFKRLRLWAEVALCYHSVNQEDRARQIVRRQLYYSSSGPEMDKYHADAPEVVTEKWDGEMRSPPPTHSPRLWCILGDLDQDPACWQRAWEISNKRYARAQRTLGDYYTRTGDLEKARDSYMMATIVNRQNNDTWSRLGSIDLRVGNWDGAIIAFQQSIMIDDTDAKTYSNLGSALLSKHAELITLQKAASHELVEQNDDDDETFIPQATREQSPKDILHQALIAYKRGAGIAHNNWQIWDNVITIAGRMQPPAFPELLMGMSAVLRIRAPTIGEEAVDIDVFRALVLEVTSRERLQDEGTTREGGVYVPPRGSLARAVIGMVERDVVPLITKRAALWTLVEKLAFYRRDYVTALACAEKAWRMATTGEVWLQEVELWKGVVAATDNLVSAYENYGAMEMADGALVEKSWRIKARSAVRGVMGKARDSWEGTVEWEALVGLLEGLKGS
jgi:tetratricopeptide (TPR) repeat protein